MVIEEKIKNALSLYESAIKDLEKSKDDLSKIESASKKAWESIVIAIKTLIEAITNEEYKEKLSWKLNELVNNKVISSNILTQYYTLEDLLHDGMVINETCLLVERKIRETKDLINDIQREIEKNSK